MPGNGCANSLLSAVRFDSRTGFQVRPCQSNRGHFNIDFDRLWCLTVQQLHRTAVTSQNAVGNLQAVQAGNQIEAIQTEQLIQMESMMASYYRAEALERARELAEAERGRARPKSFLEN